MSTTITTTPPPTWASIEASLSTLSAEDREALRRLTAPARHAWRVQQTIAARERLTPAAPTAPTAEAVEAAVRAYEVAQ